MPLISGLQLIYFISVRFKQQIKILLEHFVQIPIKTIPSRYKEMNMRKQLIENNVTVMRLCKIKPNTLK